MKLALQFPHVVYREGSDAVARIARAAEAIGFDELDLFDHVVMGLPCEGREPGPYPPLMPILEPLVALGFLAAVTERIGLGVEVLILPQRQPTLVAKQVATLDTLSGGRVRLGVGVGWQECEYEALGTDFHQRGPVMDESLALLRACWSQNSIDFDGKHFRAVRIAMEPKPPQGASIPIWVGGASPAALRRAGRLGDGWMAGGPITPQSADAIAAVKRHAEEAGRDPEALGFQAQLAPPPDASDPAGRTFYTDPERVAALAARAKGAGFGWVALNANMIYLTGPRSVDALSQQLHEFHARIRAEVGAP